MPHNEPQDSSVAIEAACQYTDQGKYDDAIKAFTCIIDQYDRHSIPRAFAHRGRAYYKSGYYELAIKDFDVALRVKPDGPATLYLRACCLYQLKQFELAADDLRRSLKIKPNQPDARELLSDILEKS